MNTSTLHGEMLDREQLKHLSRPAPIPLITHVVLEWSLIAASIMIALLADCWWATLLAITFIGTRQHALLILMHEFSHRQFSRTRIALNDALGDVFTALPLLITIHGFRRNHLMHHQRTATGDDPDWRSAARQERFRFPRRRAAMAWMLLKHGIGLYAARDIKIYLFDAQMAVQTTAGTRLRQLLFYGAVILTTAVFHLWAVVALYWIVPMLTLLLALLYLRDVGEHFAMPRPGIEASRTVITGPVERACIAPYAVSYHTEHHLYPSVPFCRLRQLHALVRESPAYQSQAVVTRGYLSGLLREAAEATPQPAQPQGPARLRESSGAPSTQRPPE